MLIHILISGIFLFLLQFADTQHGKLLNLFKTKNLFLSFALEQYSYNDNRKKERKKEMNKRTNHAQSVCKTDGTQYRTVAAFSFDLVYLSKRTIEKNK